VSIIEIGTVSDGSVVEIHYTLTDDKGEVLDSSQGDDPLPYLQGAENIVPGLERAMLGRKVGDKFKVDVAAEDGYGLREGPGAQAVPRSSFPDDVEIVPGMEFVAEDAGEELVLWVTKVTDSEVFVDQNHPLAGMSLHFQVEVVSVREATEEEKEHGHPHGPDGHGHHH